MQRAGLEWLHRVCSEPSASRGVMRAMLGYFHNFYGASGDNELADGAIRRSLSLVIFAWMPQPNILVVVVDGLRASALGAYGNTTYSTPAMDHFAAESMLFDECFAPTTDLAAIYRAMWQSYHPVRQLVADSPKPSRSLPALLAEAGYRTALMTDERQLSEIDGASDFHECHVFELGEDDKLPRQASDVLNTTIAQLFATASESICSHGGGATLQAETSRLIWVHSRGMYGTWDAPLAVQQSLLDDESPPYTSIEPPDIEIGTSDDPDIVFRVAAAYAAQVIALDAAWEVLIDAIESVSGAEQQWCIVLMGCRGFPLGEHSVIGGIDSRLTSEQLHVPWLIRYPGGRGKLARSDALVSHLDILPTLLEAAKPDSQTSPHPDESNMVRLSAGIDLGDRNIHLAANGTAVAIRTTEWCLRNAFNGRSDLARQRGGERDRRWRNRIIRPAR